MHAPGETVIFPHGDAPLDQVMYGNLEIDFCPKGHGEEGNRFKKIEYGIQEDEETKKEIVEEVIGKFECPCGHGQLSPRLIREPSFTWTRDPMSFRFCGHRAWRV